MKYYIKFLLLFSFILAYPAVRGLAQPGCASVTITTNGGNNFALPCNQPCTTLTATAIQTSGQTSSYTVSSVPYNPPYPYNTGTPILVNIDDRWSGIINLPFTFCFYGNSYNQIIAGSNGVISFNTADANGYCPWSFSSPCPSPNLILNAIFGPYHDIDPSVSGTMYYAILGTYPCRTFVVNWYQVAMFSSSCNYMKATHQIVLYETTNIIEVYIQNKPLCSSWNSGNAVVGIQNATGTVGLAAPGRNTGPWTAQNEAWRFTPSGSSLVTINWYEGSTFLGSGNSVNVCPSANTTYTAYADYSTCFGQVVTVSDEITVSLSGGSVQLAPSNPTICYGESINLTATGSDTYVWAPAAGLNTTTGSSVIASPNVTTTYTVTGTTPMCTASNTITVTVNPLPAISISPPGGSICIGDSITLTASGAVDYTWSPANTLSSSTGDVVTAFPQTTTTYTITGVDDNQCVNSTTATVVASTGPNIMIIASPEHICPGDTSVLTAYSSAQSFTWAPGISLSSTTGQTTTAFPLVTTTYTVTADNNGCLSSDTYTLEVKPLPLVDFTADVREGCQGLMVQFTDLTVPTPTSWRWHFGDNTPYGNTSNHQNPSHYYADPGSFGVTLSVISPDGCRMKLYYPDFIRVYPKPIANFDVTPKIVNELDALVWFTDQSIGATVWNWYFGEPNVLNNVSNAQNPTHIYSDTGMYYPQLIIFNNYGCSDTTSRYVKVIPNVTFYMPNAFTPNNDYRNQVFRGYGEGIDLSTFEMRIFDRWGRNVYYTNDMEKGWDGKFNGKIQPEGVYAWQVSFYDIRSKFHSYKGFVTLIH